MVSYLTIQVRVGSSRHFISIFIYNASKQLKMFQWGQEIKSDHFKQCKGVITMVYCKGLYCDSS